MIGTMAGAAGTTGPPRFRRTPLFQHRGQGVQGRTHRGQVMQEGGENRSDAAQNPQPQEDRVYPDDHRIVSVYLPHNPSPQTSGIRDSGEAVVGEHDVRDLPGDVGPAAHGYSHVGRGERGGIVDPVPHHDDPGPPRPKALDETRLFVGQHTGVKLVDGKTSGDVPGDAFLVPRHQDDPPHPILVQEVHHLPGIGTQGVLDAQEPGQLAVHRQVEDGIPLQRPIDLLPCLRTADDPLVLEDEMGAADQDLPAPPEGDDAVGHGILDLRVLLAVVKSLQLRLSDDGTRYGVRKMLLEARCDPQDVLAGPPPEGDHIGNPRRGDRQGPRLVENDGIRSGQRLQELAPLDQDPAFGPLPHGGQDR